MQSHENSKIIIQSKFSQRKLSYSGKKSAPKIIHSNLDELTKTLKCLLNKLTPTNFDTIKQSISEVISPEVAPNFSNLLLTKASLEVKYSEMYAKLCSTLLTDFPFFRPSLLNACQEIFILRANSSEDISLSKSKIVGCVTFIGQLMNIKVISPKIIIFCCEELLKKNTEDAAEAVCYLLSTCRKLFSSSKYVHFANECLELLQQRAGIYSTRLNFLIQDLIETKKLHTLSVQSNEKPETLNR